MGSSGQVVSHHHPREKRIKCERKILHVSSNIFSFRCSRIRHPTVFISIVFFVMLMLVAIITMILLFTSRKSTGNVILRWNTTGITVAGETNQPGNTSDKLNVPVALALDYLNNLYVADSLNHRIQKYRPNERIGTTVAGLANGTFGSSLSHLHRPLGIQVDQAQNMYISDKDNFRVLFWPKDSPNGTLLARLCDPDGLSLHEPTRMLYIPDYCNHRVWSYNLNTSSLKMIADTNISGFNNNQLSRPIAVHFDPVSESLIISNSAANNVVRWTLGASSWTIVAGNLNGSAGDSASSFTTPTDAILDPMGNLYVADINNHRVQFFPVGQSDGITIAGVTRKAGTSATLLDRPWFVALDSQLNLYVSDSDNHRVQKYLRY